MKLYSAVILLQASSAHAFTSGTRSASRKANVALEAEKHRVVVTGLGVVSGCGIGHKDFFQACVEGKSSLATVSRFDASAYPCSIASEVPDSMFDPKDYFSNSKNIKTNDR